MEDNDNGKLQKDSRDEAEAQEADRVTKREFIRAVAKRAGTTLAVTDAVYEAILIELVRQARRKQQVNLVGFGRFYPQRHEGHYVQTKFTPDENGSADRESGWVDAYEVLKFSGTRMLSRLLGLDGDKIIGERIPGTTFVIKDDDFAGGGGGCRPLS